MAKGANIPISVDEADAVSGLKKVEKALDTTSDAVDDLGTDAKSAARDVGKSFDSMGDDAKTAGKDIDKGISSGAKDAEQSVDKVVHQINSDIDKIKDQSKKAGDDLGANIKRGADEAAEGTETFKENAGANAKEVAASFDGSAQSIADGFQGLAAEALEGFGPAGLVAGVAVAAGIGLATQSMEKAKEKAQETAEKIADIAGELIDLGKADLGPEQIQDALHDMATTAEDGKIPLDELRKTADKAGISYSDFAQGVAGDSKALQRSYDDVSSKLDALSQGYEDTLDSQRNVTGETGRWLDANQAQQEALVAASKKLLEQDATLDRSAATARNYTDATKGITVATEEQAAATERAQEVQDSFKSALEDTADPVSVYQGLLDQKNEAEQKTAQATADATKDSKDSWEDYAGSVTVTTQDLIDTWNRQAKEAEDFEKNLAIIGANGGQALADELRAKGPEVAGATAAVIATADPNQQRAAIDAHARATGAAMGGSMASGISSQQGTVQGAVNGVAAGVRAPSVGVSVYADPASFNRTIREIQNGVYQVFVNGRATGMKYQ